MSEVTGVNFEQRCVWPDGTHFVLAPAEIAVSNPVRTACLDNFVKPQSCFRINCLN